MTMPNERARAVINTARFLVQLSSPYGKDGIKGIKREVRERARQLLRHYPRPYDLHHVAKACPDVFEVDPTIWDESE